MEDKSQGGAPSVSQKPDIQTAKPGNQDVDQTLKIVGLILNIVILPGLGTVVMKKTRDGTIQIILAVLGVVLMFTIIGFFVGLPLFAIAWIWALITSIKAFKE